MLGVAKVCKVTERAFNPEMRPRWRELVAKAWPGRISQEEERDCEPYLADNR